MVDTLTPIYGFLLQETGGNPNSWGLNLNNQVITPIENAIGGCVTISGLTGGSVNLSQASALFNTIVLTGTLASDLTITAPSQANRWTFVNKLTGNFYVLIKTAAGAAVNIPRGMTIEITCDGVNMYRHDGHKVGELFYHAGAVPAGAIECTGATPLRASAVDLFAAIGTTWGTGNGTTTFTLPDAYTAGKFLRARTASVTLGTAQADQNKAHTHTGSGTTGNNNVGHTHTFSGTTGSMNQNASHSHSHNMPGAVYNNSTPGNLAGGSGAGATTLTISNTNTDHQHAFSGTTADENQTHTHTFSFTTGSDGGTEARPTNLSAILCIRY